MSPFEIPSIFTAIDKFSAPFRAMGSNVQAFASKAESAIARSERAFNKLTPALSGAAKEFLAFASTAAITAGIVAGVAFSTQSLMDYEKSMASLSSITGLAGEALVPFKNEVSEVAKETKSSAIDVAKAFELIGSAKADLLDNADALGEVTKNAIILSKATGDDLAVSAQSLAGTLNQFSLAADQSNRVINALAAGSVAGAAAVPEITASMDTFGTVAASMNVSVEQSVALIETLAEKNIKGAEAGTKLRNVLVKMATAQSLPKEAIDQLHKFGVNTAIVSNKSLDLSVRLQELSKIQNDATALAKVFGAENLVAGQILLQNVDQVNAFTKSVTGTNTAQEQAAINSDTLTVAIEEAKAAWVNLITGTNGASDALNAAKSILKFVTNNLDTIVSIGSKVLLFFIGWKALLLASSVALGAYNIVLGIQGALSGIASVAIGQNAIALSAYKIALAVTTGATWLWTTATSAAAVAMAILTSPITLIILGIAALIAVIVLIINKWNEWGAALSIILGPLGMIISLIQSFRRNWDGIVEAFKTGGIVEGFKMIGATILDAILMPLQQVFKLLTNLPGVGEFAQKAVDGIEAFRKDIGVNVTTDESGNPIAVKKAVNPEAVRQESMTERFETSQNQNVKIEIADQTNRASVTSDNSFVPVFIGGTHGPSSYRMNG